MRLSQKWEVDVSRQCQGKKDNTFLTTTWHERWFSRNYFNVLLNIHINKLSWQQYSTFCSLSTNHYICQNSMSSIIQNIQTNPEEMFHQFYKIMSRADLITPYWAARNWWLTFRKIYKFPYPCVFRYEVSSNFNIFNSWMLKSESGHWWMSHWF